LGLSGCINHKPLLDRKRNSKTIQRWWFRNGGEKPMWEKSERSRSFPKDRKGTRKGDKMKTFMGSEGVVVGANWQEMGGLGRMQQKTSLPNRGGKGSKTHKLPEPEKVGERRSDSRQHQRGGVWGKMILGNKFILELLGLGGTHMSLS